MFLWISFRNRTEIWELSFFRVFSFYDTEKCFANVCEKCGKPISSRMLDAGCEWTGRGRNAVSFSFEVN